MCYIVKFIISCDGFMENFIVGLGNWKWLCIKILVDNFVMGWLENSWFLNYLLSFWVVEIM